MSGFLRFFKRKSKETPKKEINLKGTLKDKYLDFQSLLGENNRVLMLMADMEEKLSGECLFDRHYLNSSVAQVEDSVSKIIGYLNSISGDGYADLKTAYSYIDAEIKKILSRRTLIPESALVIPLSDLNKDMALVAGSKMANLAEVRNRLCLPSPDGFSITSTAFKRFMKQNIGEVNEMLSSISPGDLKALENTSMEIRKIIETSPLPDDIGDAIEKALDELFKKGGGEIKVAVRSSAIFEDGEFSFAGQYATFLNVPRKDVHQRYKAVIASLFSTRALFYFKTKGFSEDDLVMAVGVLGMVDAARAGVMYTKDPNFNDPAGECALINAAYGLGMAVVDGAEKTESCLVRIKTREIVNRVSSGQQAMFVCAPEGDIRREAVKDGTLSGPCLTDKQIGELLELGLRIEAHFGRPEDIEWAIDKQGRAFILQCRPLRTSGIGAEGVPRKVEGYNILIHSGVVACKGIAYGKAFVLEDEQRLNDFPEGAVLVARHTSTKFVTVMQKASAIITDVGSATGHMASLSREYGVPTILDTSVASSLIKDGQELTVDAFNGNIYEGRVEELIKHAGGRRDSFRETRLFMLLEDALKLIVPLNLVDPDGENFKPGHCRTLHDITRFAHETAMAEIFKTGKGQAVDGFEAMMSEIALAEEGAGDRLGSQMSALRAGIPVDAHLLDIEGGIDKASRKVRAENITSIPFGAFLKGMVTMRWPGPPPADVKGFLGMVARTAAIREDELQKMGGKSYAIISKNYMNFSIRLGYHFSMVEAYAGENINDNYIKFFFKGGGASLDRRLRRVRLITEILKRLGFRLTVKEDVIDAILTKYKQSTIEETLTAMGKLTAYTKQLDMALYNNAVTDMFIEEFLRDHIKAD